MWSGICPGSSVVVEYIIIVTVSKLHISSYYNTSTYHVRFSKCITLSPRDSFDCGIRLVSIESHRRLNCKPQEITEAHNIKWMLVI